MADNLAIMRICYLIVILLSMSSSVLHADLTLKIRTITGTGRTSESTEYYKGDLMRRDFASGYQVIDFSTGRSFSVDPKKEEYYPFDGARLAIKRVVDPSRKIFVETTCSATGEQRQLFGYVAYRYLTNKRSHDEFNGKSSETRETQLDTWVLDLAAPPHVRGIASPNVTFLAAVSGGGVMNVPDVKATHVGPRPNGLIVQSKSEQYESEVVALSVAPLQESLFQVPTRFREVTSPALEVQPRSWSDQLTIEWLRFRAWLDSLLAS